MYMENVLLQKIKKLKRYEDFTFLDKPVNFAKYFKDKPYDVVQIHDMTPCGEDDIVGFAGSFCWFKNTPRSLDGDDYTSNMNVWGFSEFNVTTKEEEILLGLDILTDCW